MSDNVDSKNDGCGSGCSCGAERAGLLVTPIDRRRFISIGAYAAAVTALTGCIIRTETVSGPGSAGSISATVKVSDYAALSTVGGVAVTTVNGTPIAIVRTGASTFATLSRVCPHQGSTVNQTSSGFKCPNHGATFDKSGTWTGGQRTSNMTTLTTAYDATTGTLTINGTGGTGNHGGDDD